MKHRTVVRISALIMTVMVIAVCFSGCGSHEKAIRETADGMLSAIQMGDLEKVSDFASEEMVSDGDLAMMGAMKTFSEDMMNELGASEETTSEESKAAIDELGTTILTAYLKSYEIGEIQEEEGVGYVACSLVYGYDPKALENKDYLEDINAAAKEYTLANVEELARILKEQGENALAQKIINDIMPSVCDIIQSSILSTGEQNENAILKVEKVDGKWKVTEAKLYEPGSETESESESESETESQG